MTSFQESIDGCGTKADLGRGAETAVDELAQARERLKAEFVSVLTGWRRAIYAEKRAIGLALFDAGWRFAGFVGLALTGAAVAISAALLFVSSLRRGLASWTQGAWWADLVLAVLLAGLVAAAAHMLRRGVHRATLAETRRHLATTSQEAAS